MPKKLTDKFVREFINSTGDKLLEECEYINNETKMDIICQHCNIIYKTNWHSFNNHNIRCSCQINIKKRMKTVIPFYKIIEMLKEEGYTTEYDGKDYSGSKHRFKVKCKLGHSFNTSRDEFIGGRRCCHTDHKKEDLNIIKRNKKLYKTTKESILKRIEIYYGKNTYEILELSDTITVHTYIKLKCNICNNEFSKRINNLFRSINPSGCPTCSLEKIRLGKDKFIKIVEEKFPNCFDFTEFIYINNKTKSIILCKKCGKKFKQSPSGMFKGNNGCVTCNQSGGERDIQTYLELNNIEYEKQYTIGRLRMDFYIPKYNAFIEFDGKQHFEHIPYFCSYEDFLKAIKRDEFKNEYCHGSIPLLRIAYYDQKNIKNILDKWFKCLELFHEIHDVFKANNNKIDGSLETGKIVFKYVELYLNLYVVNYFNEI